MAPRLWLAVLVIVCAPGCADMFPSWLHPGSAPLQQSRAEFFDPYPNPDMAPEVGGGRPHDYTRPPPENEQAQNPASFSYRYGHAPPPGLFRPEAPAPPPAYVPPTIFPR